MPTSCTTISVSLDPVERLFEQLFFSRALTNVIPLMVLQTKAEAKELKANPENSITKARSIPSVPSKTLIKHHVPGYWYVYVPKLKKGRRATHSATNQISAKAIFVRAVVTNWACNNGFVTPKQRSAAIAQPIKSGHSPKNTMHPPRNKHDASVSIVEYVVGSAEYLLMTRDPLIICPARSVATKELANSKKVALDLRRKRL